MLSSLTGPAVIPSGGSWERVRYSLNRRLAASGGAVIVDFRFMYELTKTVRKKL